MPKTAEEKELEARRAEATQHAAALYMARHRAGDELPVPACCDLTAAETGLPRPAESTVRRAIAKLRTPDEKLAKRQKDAAADRRAAATKRAAEMYKERNGRVAEGEEAAVSVSNCCDMAAVECGVRPAESSLRRALDRLYKEEGIEPPKLKKARPSPPPGAAGASAAAVTPVAAAAASKPKAKRKPKKATAETPSHMPSDEQFAAGLLGFGAPASDEVEIVQV